VDGTPSANRKREMQDIWMGKYEGRQLLLDLGVVKMIILNMIFQK
jgi:hypothetical protein